MRYLLADNHIRGDNTTGEKGEIKETRIREKDREKWKEVVRESEVIPDSVVCTFQEWRSRRSARSARIIPRRRYGV